MSRYSAIQCDFDKIIIIRGVVKTIKVNSTRTLGGGKLTFFGLNGYWYLLLNRVCAYVG